MVGFGIFSFKTWSIIALVLFILVVLDTIYSVYVAYNLRNRIIIVEELKNEKLAKLPMIFDKKLRELSEGIKGFPNRLLKAFPDLERQYHNSFEKMKEYRLQEKEKRKELKEKYKNKYKKKR